ncbi:MAG: hypothetical protein M1144_06520 [Candidatus Thermoplasmatota archaeon]|nr:hypothetical protein [Candidatus Thermoplasmatota archaeon]
MTKGVINHAEFMERPGLWPTRGKLPLKRYPPTEFAVMTEDFKVTMEDGTVLEYDSADDVLRDGWLVD